MLLTGSGGTASAFFVTHLTPTAEIAMEHSGHDTFGSDNLGSELSGIANSNTSTPGTAGNATATAGYGDKLADAGASVREKAGSLKNSIADALESGAEKLRRQNAGGQLATGSAATGSVVDTIAEETRIAQTSQQIAGGMQGAADWLREADLDGVKSGVERQVKDHPGRSLAIAVGVGYLLGKAFRR